MGIFKGIGDSITGTFADQFKDIITVAPFDEQTVVSPGLHQTSNSGRGANLSGSAGVISNGSIIRIPEHVAAFIFSQSAIEQVITTPGEFIYENGEASIFNKDDLTKSLVRGSVNRLGFGGQPSTDKHVAYVNLREIRGLKFGTPGPLMYNDGFYGADLEIIARGSFSIHITDAEKFVRNYLPANVTYYSFADAESKRQIGAEFLQSFMQALNALSAEYRVSQLPAQSQAIDHAIMADSGNAGTWEERFGFELTSVALENIAFSDESRELVKQYSSKKMNVSAFSDVSQRAANIAAQQNIAEGVRENGLGDGGGMVMGMNLGQAMNPQTAQSSSDTTAKAMSFDEQIEAVKKLKDLLDAGILNQAEFDQKKREIMGL